MTRQWIADPNLVACLYARIGRGENRTWPSVSGGLAELAAGGVARNDPDVVCC